MNESAIEYKVTNFENSHKSIQRPLGECKLSNYFSLSYSQWKKNKTKSGKDWLQAVKNNLNCFCSLHLCCNLKGKDYVEA